MTDEGLPKLPKGLFPYLDITSEAVKLSDQFKHDLFHSEELHKTHWRQNRKAKAKILSYKYPIFENGQVIALRPIAELWNPFDENFTCLCLKPECVFCSEDAYARSPGACCDLTYLTQKQIIQAEALSYQAAVEAGKWHLERLPSLDLKAEHAFSAPRYITAIIDRMEADEAYEVTFSRSDGEKLGVKKNDHYGVINELKRLLILKITDKNTTKVKYTFCPKPIAFPLTTLDQ